MSKGKLRIGIDVGGTHTDAAILGRENHLVHATKTQTTGDVTSGVVRALQQVVREAGIDTGQVEAVMFGTTHCTNAVVERKGLARTGLIRLGSPATHAIKPLLPLPLDLVEALGDMWAIVAGGHEFDGRELSELDEGAVEAAAVSMRAKGVEAIAVSGTFSPVNPDHEDRALAIIKRVCGDSFPVTVSHEIGAIGLLERENASALNAALVNVAKRAVNAFTTAIQDMHLTGAKLFLTQNDGSLMSTEYALKYPIKTISSGPTNSIRGAGFLTGMSDTIVVDIGGTTTLVGVLVNGFPRESAVAAMIGGVRTNFRMPDLVAVGCGGGTIVRTDADGAITLGPDSLGYNLVKSSQSFGGSVVTTTDIALASGYAEIDDPRCKKERLESLDRDFVRSAADKIVQTVQEAIEKMKTKSEPVPVVLVGGGGLIIPRSIYGSMPGVSLITRPDHFQYANAIGAAIAQVSGEVDRVFSLEGTSREEVLRQARGMAIADATRAGAKEGSVEIVEVEEIPISYLPGNAIRLRVKAAGELLL